MDVVTYEILYDVLKKLPIARGMGDKDLKDLAYYIVNFFGYGDRIVDNILTPEDRHVFIMLEEMGILKTYEEEVTLVKGKLWRIHYWAYRKQNIEKIRREGYIKDERKDDVENIYDEVFKKIWAGQQ